MDALLTGRGDWRVAVLAGIATIAIYVAVHRVLRPAEPIDRREALLWGAGAAASKFAIGV